MIHIWLFEVGGAMINTRGSSISYQIENHRVMFSWQVDMEGKTSTYLDT